MNHFARAPITCFVNNISWNLFLYFDFKVNKTHRIDQKKKM